MSSTVVLGLIGSSVILVLLFEMLRRRKLREKYAVFWVIVALCTLVVAVFPGLLARASNALGVEVPSNLLFFVASMVLFVVSVQHSSEARSPRGAQPHARGGACPAQDPAGVARGRVGRGCLDQRPRRSRREPS